MRRHPFRLVTTRSPFGISEVERFFSHTPRPAVEVSVARALVGRGFGLNQLGRPAEAIPVFEEVEHRYARAAEPDFREQVAAALVGKGLALRQTGRPEQAIAAYDEVERRFAQAPESDIQEEVARALVNRGVTLRDAGRPTEALSLYEEVERRFASASEFQLGAPLRWVVGPCNAPTGGHSAPAARQAALRGPERVSTAPYVQVSSPDANR